MVITHKTRLSPREMRQKARREAHAAYARERKELGLYGKPAHKWKKKKP